MPFNGGGGGGSGTTYNGGMLKTGQTTVYLEGDDGSYQKGITKSYTVLSTGGFSGTVPVDSPHYAAATLSFVAATKTIADTAALLASVKTGDTIRIRGSASNDGVYTVATGNVAGAIVTNEALVNEAAAAYITICKRVTPSNNVVQDNNTGLLWRRYATGGPVEKVGPASDGKLVWYDATLAYTLHPAGADLQMIAAPATLRIVGGAGEVARYFAGAVIVQTGFANAVNNRVGKVITGVAINGADLDLSLQTFGATLIAEAAGGSRDIKIVCQSVFSYCAAMNTAVLGGYSDWRVPNGTETWSLTGGSGQDTPDSTAFPGWPNVLTWASGTTIGNVTNALQTDYGWPRMGSAVKTGANQAAFVRGG